LLPLLLCVALAACSSTSENTMTFFADPGKFQYHNCDQLATAAKALTARQKDLKTLIDKAEQGAAGVFVGAIAYRSDYAAVTEDLRVLDGTARAKNCPAPTIWRSNTVIQ
jgi:ABC-type transporter Mla subunit MlaD